MKSVHIVLILSSVSFASAFWPGWFSSGDEGGAEAAQPATNSSSNNSGWPAALSKIADFFGSAIPYDADESWYESEAEDEEPTIVKKEAESAEAGEGERLSKDESGAAAIQEPILEPLVVEHGDPKLAAAEAVLTSEPVSEIGETEGAESIPVAKMVESEEEDYDVPVAEPVFQIEVAFEAVADIDELSHEAQSSLDKKPEKEDFNDGDGDGAAFVFSSNSCNEEQMIPTQESFATDQIIPESPPLSEDFDFADIYPENADVIPEYPQYDKAEDNGNNATSADFDYAHIFKDEEDDETVLDTTDDAKKEVELQSLLKQKPAPTTPAQVKLRHVEPTPKKPFETNQNVPFKIPLRKVEPSPAKEAVKVEHEFMKARDKIMEKASLARKEEAEKAQKGANAPNAKLSLYPTSTYFDGDFDKLKPAVKIQVPTELSMKQNTLNRYNRLQTNPLKSVKRTAKV